MDPDTDTDTDDQVDETPLPTGEDGAPIVEIGGRPVTLVRCTFTQTLSLHVDPDDPKLEDLGYKMSVGAAALRACWPEGEAWPARKRPRPWRLGVSAAEYGLPILEALAAEIDTPLRDLSRALERARFWAASCTMRAADVKKAQDFSQAPEAQATPGA